MKNISNELEEIEQQIKAKENEIARLDALQHAYKILANSKSK